MVLLSDSKKIIKKSIGIGFEKNLVSEKVLVSVSKIFGIEKSIGFGFEKFWYRKKYRYRYRKNLVSEKVSDSVSKKFGIGKKFRIRFRSDFGYRHTLQGYCSELDCTTFHPTQPNSVDIAE